MRIVVHLGMHKTGSSTIQEYLYRTPVPGAVYARSSSPNHSSLFVLLFDDPENLPKYHGFRARGPDFVADLPAQRRKARAALEAQLDALAGTDCTLIFSGEDISSPRFGAARARMHAFFRRWSDDLSAIAYVRSPLSYCVSAFQQQLKGAHPVDPGFARAWPRYRGRFEQIDSLFGRENVQLRRFAPEALKGGDVLEDFADRLGLSLPPRTAPLRVNESLGLEATALLYVQRRLGRKLAGAPPGPQRVNPAFVELLRGVGRRRFTFAPAVWDEVVAANRADLDWMERRLGEPLQDAVPEDAVPVSGEEELFAIAAEHAPEIARLLRAQLDMSPEDPLERTVQLLDSLHVLSGAGTGALPAAAVRARQGRR